MLASTKIAINCRTKALAVLPVFLSTWDIWCWNGGGRHDLLLNRVQPVVHPPDVSLDEIVGTGHPHGNSQKDPCVPDHRIVLGLLSIINTRAKLCSVSCLGKHPDRT